jgi:hypothetical protein
MDQGFWNDMSLGMLRDFMAHGSPLAGNGVRYQITKGSLTGSLYVFTGSSPKVQGSTTVRSACFDAGSAAAKLPSGPESFSLPHTPSSSASG